MSSQIDPAKLKVVELRAELSARGLDSKGNKPVLVQRLKEALEKELNQDDNSVDSTAQEEVSNEESKKDETSAIHTDNDVEMTEAKSTVESEEKPVPKDDVVDKIEEDKPNEPIVQEQISNNQNEDVKEQNGEHVSEEALLEEETLKPVQIDDRTSPLPEEEKSQEEKMDTVINEVEKSQVVEKIEEKNDSRGEKRKHSPSPSRSQRRRSKSPIKEDEPEIDNDKVQLSWYDSDLHLQVDKETFLSAKPYHDGAFGYVWAGVRATHGVKLGKVCFEVKITEELKWEDIIKQPEKGRSYDKSKHKKSNREDTRKNKETKESNQSEKEEPKELNESSEKEEGKELNQSEKEESKESNQSEKEENKESTQSEKEENKNVESIEENPEIKNDEKEETVLEDESKEKSNDNDANNLEHNENEELEVKKDTNDEEKMDVEKKDVEKMDVEKKDVEKMDVDIQKVEEIVPHLIRIGWSLASTDLQLGESEHSFGYESSGKFVNNGKFTEYGIPFQVGDVVGAYMDIDDDNVSFVYTVNGNVQPVALTLSKTDLPDENCAFFPHVLSKNYSFELNLGNREEPWFSNIEGHADYIFLDKIEDKIAGPVRPTARSECEVIMMCGLPASGKTHWVRDYLKKNPDKKYTVLGNSFLLNKMTVNGCPLKDNYKNCWNQVLDKLTKSLNKLMEIAALRRRNYILDHTNVYPSAQKRKMRSFEGFKRRAVVVVVSEEEQAKRQTLQQEQNERDVSDNTVLELKACMSIPRVGDLLEEVMYAELGEEEAKAAVQKYNTQGKEAGYGPSHQNQIKSRHDNRNRWQNRRDSRGGNYRDQRHYNNRYDRNNAQGRHGYWNPRPGSGWNNRNDRRDNRGNRDYRNNRGTAARYQDRGRTESRKSNFNRRPNYPPNRNHSGPWQSSSGGGGGGAAAWSGNQNAWAGQNQSSWQNWNPSESNWNNQSQSQYKQYNQQGYSQQPQSQGYGHYSNWNYYGQYPQNWNSQGQPNNLSSSQTSQSGQYNQMTPQQQQQAWAQYTQQLNTQNSQQPVQK